MVKLADKVVKYLDIKNNIVEYELELGDNRLLNKGNINAVDS